MKEALTRYSWFAIAALVALIAIAAWLIGAFRRPNTYMSSVALLLGGVVFAHIYFRKGLDALRNGDASKAAWLMIFAMLLVIATLTPALILLVRIVG